MVYYFHPCGDIALAITLPSAPTRIFDYIGASASVFQSAHLLSSRFLLFPIAARGQMRCYLEDQFDLYKVLLHNFHLQRSYCRFVIQMRANSFRARYIRVLTVPLGMRSFCAHCVVFLFSLRENTCIHQMMVRIIFIPFCH